MFPWKKTQRRSRRRHPYILEISLTMHDVLQDLDPGWFPSPASADTMEVA